MSGDLHGRIVCGTGGLYTVLFPDEKILRVKARGLLRLKNITPFVGDTVTVRRGEGDERGIFIDRIDARKTELSRPPVANIDTVFIAVASADPEPNFFYTDKLLCSVADAGIKPVVVITKSDVSPEMTRRLTEIYSSGYTVIVTSSETGDGVSALSEYIKNNTEICAFAGASGVGKSTLISAVFPSLALKSGEISSRSRRGKHTTRTVELFPTGFGGFIADTPGFTMLDMDEIDCKRSDRLFFMFPEFEKYFGACKYRGCTHVKEEGCEIIAAVSRGEISPTRHESYVALFSENQNRHK